MNGRLISAVSALARDYKEYQRFHSDRWLWTEVGKQQLFASVYFPTIFFWFLKLSQLQILL